jgi:hypothetical protein
VSPGGVGVVAPVIGIGIGRAVIAIDIDAIGAVPPPVTAVARACRPAVAVARKAALKITLKPATNVLWARGATEMRKRTTGASAREWTSNATGEEDHHQ